MVPFLKLASLAAGPPVGLSMDQFGRKATMLSLSVPFLLGWLLISFAKNLPMIYGGRILTGELI
jgi:predicted MFS family arabinose efflux permease